MQSLPWRYVGKSDLVRLAALAHPLPHAELAGALQSGLQLVCFHRDPLDKDHRYKRAVFCGKVSGELFDWFFNARTGYRGAYFESPDAGSRANRLLVDQLAHFLTDWAIANQLDHDRQRVLASLAQPSAKAWLAEYPGLCNQCKYEWHDRYVSELQIENSRWECSSRALSFWGRQAPRFSKIRIFGGFIDAQQNEKLAPHKAHRAREIWHYGWS